MTKELEYDWMPYLGDVIIKLLISEEKSLNMYFSHGLRYLCIFDAGQTCCESRWMTCDDPLDEHIGARFMGVELLGDFSEKIDGGKKEVQFLRVITSAGSFRLCMHNEHSGYYGGFSPSIVVKK